MIATTTTQIETATEAGRRLGEVLEKVAGMVVPGVSTQALEDAARTLIEDGGDKAAFLNYTPEGAKRPYPAALCISVNDEVVHGIPNEAPKILKKGDIVSLDLGLVHEGMVMDSALTVVIGKTDEAAYKLLNGTQEALYEAIAVARAGNRIGDISYTIGQALKRHDLGVVTALGGHGVGAHVHEPPYIANDGTEGTGPAIEEGMILALEPIATEGKGRVEIASDGYTYVTKDGSRAAHFEHTILITKGDPVILTRRPHER